MKAATTALLAVFAFQMACLAQDKPRTIVTRDHQVYENALIVHHDSGSVTISYDAGIVRVAPGNLPADIQMELGYISKMPETPHETASAPPAPAPVPPQASPPANPGPANAPPQAPAAAVAVSSAATEDHTPPPEKPAPAPVKIFTQAKADAIYGMKESAILKKWGKPLRIEKFTSISRKKVTVLIYDEDETTGTKFFIYEKDGFVSGGYCNGTVIRSPAEEASLARAKTPGN